MAEDNAALEELDENESELEENHDDDGDLPTGRTPRDSVIKKITKRGKEDRGEVEPEPEPEVMPEPEPEDDTVLVKIDGVEQRVKRDQVLDAGIRTYQKETAADKRLQEASLRMRELQAYEQQLRQREAQLRAPLPQKRDEGTKPQSDDSEAYRKAAEAIYSGDEDKAAAALKEFAERIRPKEQPRATPQIDPDRLVSEAVQRTRYQMTVENAQQSFREEYSDIAADPVLFRLADEETLRIIDQNPDWDPKRVIMQAGHNVREWVKTHGGGLAPVHDESKKLEDKKRAVKPVQGASGKVPRKPEAKPKTRSQVIADMRKARGLPD